MTAKLKSLVVASALLLALAGCSGGTPSASGTWGQSTTHGKPYLELMSGGKLAGSDGCNRLAGNWKQSGSTVTFGSLSSTRAFCQGVDTWLVHAESATVSGSTMTVLNDNKSKIGTLTKTK